LFYLRKNLKEICLIQIVCHLNLDPIYEVRALFCTLESAKV
jgi:hypothetical protein